MKQFQFRLNELTDGLKSVFSDRTDSASAVQYFQVLIKFSCLSLSKSIRLVTIFTVFCSLYIHEYIHVFLQMNFHNMQSSRKWASYFVVLWIPLTTTEHDAGLYKNINIPKGNVGQLNRFP